MAYKYMSDICVYASYFHTFQLSQIFEPFLDLSLPINEEKPGRPNVHMSSNTKKEKQTEKEPQTPEPLKKGSDGFAYDSSKKSKHQAKKERKMISKQVQELSRSFTLVCSWPSMNTVRTCRIKTCNWVPQALCSSFVWPVAFLATHLSPGSSRRGQGTTGCMGWTPSRLGARYSSSLAGLHRSGTISFRLIVCVCRVAMICIALWLGARITWPSASDFSILFDP
jgi:hypothetical protein